MLKKEYMIIVSVIILFLLLQKNVSADFPSCPGDTTDGIWVITDRQIITGNTVCYNITIKSGGKLLVQNGAIISSINITLGNLSVEYGGEINATGFGYIGSSSTATGPGAGISRRAGGSYGGRGGAAQETNIGNVYGDPLRPTDLGSGGSGSGTTSGAGGGGSILINVTQNFILNGAVIANGNNTISGSNLGAGSGGSILLYTYNLTGTGNLSARGGKSASSSGGGGGGGRIAVYYNHTTLNFSRSTAEGSKDDAGFQGSTGTFIAVNQIYNNATIYAWNWNSSVTLSSFSNITFVSANTTIDNNDIIKIDNRFYFDGQSYFNCRTNISKQITVSEIETGNISSYLSNFKNECGMTNVTINTSSNIIISNNNLLNFSILNFDNSSVDIEIINSRITSNINFTIRNITIDTLSWINSSGKGYSGGIASGLGPGGPIRGGTGASYGGRGMSATHTNDINVYGNPLKPTALGSGGSGSGSTRGGTGGGFIYINATNNLILNGMLKSDGTESFGGLGGSGGGSGGSILLYSYNLTGTGNISAIGGPGFNIVSSGGRIAVYYNHTTLNFSRSTAEGTKTSISGTLPLVSASGTFIAVNQIYNNATIYAWNWNSSVDLSIYSNITFVSANTSLDNSDIIRVDNNFIFDGQSYIYCKSNLTRQFTISDIGNGNMSKFLSGFKTECPLTNATINTSSNIIISNNNLLNFSILNFDNSSVDIEIINSRITSNINFTIRNITINDGSVINATGKGYSGGTLTGSGTGGATYTGSGGSYGGRGGYISAYLGLAYGDPLKPTDLGSGGSSSGGNKGGNGGGSIYINATNKIILDSQLIADGANGIAAAVDYGGGSGGSILLYSYNLTGTGNLSARGGPSRNGNSGGGRIAVYYNHTTLNFSKLGVAGQSNTLATSTGTFIAVNQIYNNATIYAWNWNSSVDLSIYSNITFVSANTSLDNSDIIRVDNNFIFDGQSYFNCRANYTHSVTISEIGNGNMSKFLSGFKTECSLTNATINTSSNLLMTNNNLFNFSIINLDNNGIDFIIENSKVYGNINFTIRNFSLDINSWLNSTGKGYSGPFGIGNSSGRTGASYGGLGGSTSAKTYGNPLEPKDLGSGTGGSPANGVGVGGGTIFLNISNKLTLDGVVSADGMGPSKAGGADAGGAGSGGSILLYTYNLTGTGNLSAKGGDIRDNSPDSSGGGGGRIAVYYNYTTMNFLKSNVSGGESDTSYSRAEPGTFIAIDIRNNIATIIEAFEFNASHFVNDSKFKPFANSSFTFENITFRGGDEIRISSNISFNITNLNWSTTKINTSDYYLEIIYENIFNDSLTIYKVNNSFNLSIERRNIARIDFLSNLSYLTNISAAINISPNFVKVNSTLIPKLNMSSRLTFYNVTGDNGIPLYDINDNDNFIICRYDRCSQKNFTADLKKFSVVVSSFTTYTTINDSVQPNIIFTYPTEINNTYVNRNWIFINTTIIETNPDNSTYLLMNGTGVVNSTLFYMTNSSANNTINFTTLTDGNFLGLTEGIYNYNVTVIDLANNKNTTETRTITLDRTAPVVSFNLTTTPDLEVDNIIAIGLDIIETNTANITYNIYNLTGLTNSTVYTMYDRHSNTSISKPLTETILFKYGINVTDKANNIGNTPIRTVDNSPVPVTPPTGGSTGSSTNNGGSGGSGGEPKLTVIDNQPPLKIIESDTGKTEGIIQTPHGEVNFRVTDKGGIFALNINSSQGAAEIGLTFINASYGINVPKLDIKLKNGGKLKLVPTIDFKLPVIDTLSLLLLIILLIIIISYEYYRYKKKEELSKVPPHLRYVPITRPITSFR